MLKTRLMALALALALLLTTGLALAEGLEVVEDAGTEAAEGGAVSDQSDALLLEVAPEEDALISNAAEGEALPEERQSVYYPAATMPDSDALFAGYVDALFGRRVLSNGYAADQLTGLARKMFDYLSAQVVAVAAGELSDTYFYFPESVVSYYDLDDAFENMGLVLDVILVDHPYEMYWCDKTAGLPYGYNAKGMYIGLTVASEYAASAYTTKSSAIKAAQTAAQNARKVVKKCAALSDYDKLMAYMNYICDAITYNYDAASGRMSYGNPWQMIWVFDGDPDTNVVCEGYSKAFQYLCDMTDFQNDIRCLSVSGYMNGGNHMWNILRMEDGKNYLADLTNSDGDSQGSNGDLFLRGYASADGNTYFYTLMGGWGSIRYTYDAETLGVFPAKALKMSKADYDPATAPVVEPGQEPTGVAIAQGKSTTLYMGNKLTLTANLTPRVAESKLTWSSSKPAVATVSKKGVVTPKKAGTTKITVATANGKKAKITVKVVDAKSVKLAQGKKATVKVGKKLSLTATVSPKQVNSKLTWKSSNTKVATVSKKGVVKGKKAGKAKITVTTANGKKATITITVKK